MSDAAADTIDLDNRPLVYRTRDQLTPFEDNPRTHSPEQIRQIRASYEEFGFTNPLLIDEANMVMAGHGRMQAIEIDQYPCIQITGLTDEQKRALVIADNQIALNAAWDKKLLKLNIAGLKTIDHSLLGFKPYRLTNILRYDEGTDGILAEVFGAPPFSVLDARQGYWGDRKRWWNAKIGDLGETREDTLSRPGDILGVIGGTSILDATLAEIVCRWFTKPRFKIFDCFSGDTVFGYVAGAIGLDFTGIELRQEQVDLNNEQCKDFKARYICDDALNMNAHIRDRSMDFFFTCPPYADLEVYSDNPQDLSTMDRDHFFDVLQRCLANTYAKLKQNRFAVVVVSEVRNKATGAYIGLVPATIRIMEEAGYLYWNEMMLINVPGTLPLRAGKQMHHTRKIGRTHQNVLVFYKGDQKQIQRQFGKVQAPFRIEASDADEGLEPE